MINKILKWSIVGLSATLGLTGTIIGGVALSKANSISFTKEPNWNRIKNELKKIIDDDKRNNIDGIYNFFKGDYYEKKYVDYNNIQEYGYNGYFYIQYGNDVEKTYVGY